jgi:hypothetical protein
LKLYKEDDARPLISGEFTNWEPKRMIRIDEYAYALDPYTGKQGLDIFDLLRAKGGISAGEHKDLKRLKKYELDYYIQFKKETMALYNKVWFEYLSENILYKKPFMGNG